MSDDTNPSADLIERLEAAQRGLAGKIALLNEAKKKDIWDKLGSLGTILVAIIGAIFSYIYQNHQSKQDAILKGQQTHLQQIQTVAPFMSYLTGADDKARTVALFEVKDLLSPEVAVALAVNVNSASNATGGSGPDKGVVRFLKDVQRTGNTSSARQLASEALKEVCGIERWHIKTAVDQGAVAVLAKANAPVKATVEQMVSLQAPEPDLSVPLPDDVRAAPAEQTVYSITATLIALKHERDGDYHLVLQGASGRTMVAEIPSPDCYQGDGTELANEFQMARGLVDSTLVKPSAYTQATKAVVVTVTGIGFFDIVHGAMGAAPNGIELHPVLKIALGQ